MLSIQPKIRLTITYGVCISEVVELAWVGSATNEGTPSSLLIFRFTSDYTQGISVNNDEIFLFLFDRPGVARAVLQTVS